MPVAQRCPVEQVGVEREVGIGQVGVVGEGAEVVEGPRKAPTARPRRLVPWRRDRHQGGSHPFGPLVRRQWIDSCHKRVLLRLRGFSAAFGLGLDSRRGSSRRTARPRRGWRSGRPLLESDELGYAGDEEQECGGGEALEVEATVGDVTSDCVDLQPSHRVGHLGDLRGDRLAVVAESEELGGECRRGFLLAVLPQNSQRLVGSGIERGGEPFEVLFGAPAGWRP